MITKTEALSKLADNPLVAREFDAATAVEHPGLTREQAVEITVKALNLKRDKSETLAKLKKESAELKAQLSKLKADAAIKTASLKPSQPNPSMKSTPIIKPVPALAPQLVTAAAFASPIITMSREEFNKLSPSDKTRLFKEGGKLI